jgi:hypothetical protein
MSSTVSRLQLEPDPAAGGVQSGLPGQKATLEEVRTLFLRLT